MSSSRFVFNYNYPVDYSDSENCNKITDEVLTSDRVQSECRRIIGRNCKKDDLDVYSKDDPRTKYSLEKCDEWRSIPKERRNMRFSPSALSNRRAIKCTGGYIVDPSFTDVEVTSTRYTGEGPMNFIFDTGNSASTNINPQNFPDLMPIDIIATNDQIFIFNTIVSSHGRPDLKIESLNGDEYPLLNVLGDHVTDTKYVTTTLKEIVDRINQISIGQQEKRTVYKDLGIMGMIGVGGAITIVTQKARIRFRIAGIDKEFEIVGNYTDSASVDVLMGLEDLAMLHSNGIDVGFNKTTTKHHNDLREKKNEIANLMTRMSILNKVLSGQIKDVTLYGEHLSTRALVDQIEYSRFELNKLSDIRFPAYPAELE